jgi:hypothetical protein
VPDQLIALGIIDQGRQIDHLQRSHGSVPANGQCLPAQQPKASKERHNLLSDTGPMVVPLGSAASTLKPRMSLGGFPPGHPAQVPRRSWQAGLSSKAKTPPERGVEIDLVKERSAQRTAASFQSAALTPFGRRTSFELRNIP